MKFGKLMKNKTGEVASDEVLKWLLYLLLIGIGVIVIRNIFLKFA